jgi:hypothetical protein
VCVCVCARQAREKISCQVDFNQKEEKGAIK